MDRTRRGSSESRRREGIEKSKRDESEKVDWMRRREKC
jgi:hypothetical protein